MPLSITYEYYSNGILKNNTVTRETYPLWFEISESGKYTIVSYSNRFYTVEDTSIKFNVDEVAPPHAWLTGGGEFCEDEPVDPIRLNLSGAAPWSVIYQKNFGNAINEILYSDNKILLENDGAINLRKVSDLHCNSEIYDTASIQISEIPTAIISGAQEFCVDGSTIYQTPFKSNYKYQWFVPAGAAPDLDEDFQANTLPIKWISPGDYNIDLTVENANTGCNIEKTYQVKVYDDPEVRKDFDTVICFEREKSLDFNPAASAGNEIFWPHSNEYSQEISLNEPGEYIYIESIPFGCSDTGNFRVIDMCTAEIYVAKAFSPNNDEINDVLEVHGIFYSLSMKFYSSNGELVYVMEPGSDWWNGQSMSGENMPAGSYYWTAEFKDKYDGEYANQGWVTIIR